MIKTKNSKPYNLGERTFAVSRKVIDYLNGLPKNISNLETGKQLIRSAGSVGANYLEAEESLSRKDFLMRIKISRKEAKECRYWLRLTLPDENAKPNQDILIQESTELTKIFGSILSKIK